MKLDLFQSIEIGCYVITYIFMMKIVVAQQKFPSASSWFPWPSFNAEISLPNKNSLSRESSKKGFERIEKVFISLWLLSFVICSTRKCQECFWRCLRRAPETMLTFEGMKLFVFRTDTLCR